MRCKMGVSCVRVCCVPITPLCFVHPCALPFGIHGLLQKVSGSVFAPGTNPNPKTAILTLTPSQCRDPCSSTQACMPSVVTLAGTLPSPRRPSLPARLASQACWSWRSNRVPALHPASPLWSPFPGAGNPTADTVSLTAPDDALRPPQVNQGSQRVMCALNVLTGVPMNEEARITVMGTEGSPHRHRRVAPTPSQRSPANAPQLWCESSVRLHLCEGLRGGA